MVVSMVAVAVVLIVLVAGFGMYERARARVQRAELLALRPEAASTAAATEVVQARSRFGQAVEAYEVELMQSRTETTIDVSVPGGALTLGPSGEEKPWRGHDVIAETTLVSNPPEPDLARLERNKDAARADLVEAQQRWEQAKPTDDTDAEVQLWSGFGTLRGWQLGLIGFERSFIRCEHVIDPSCWAAWEVKRFRFGLAFGAETQHLAFFGAAVPTSRLGELVGRCLGGTEMAVRPGFAPARWWRRRSRSDQPRLATEALLSQDSVQQPEFAGTRSAVDAAFESELTEPVEQVKSLGDTEGVLSVLTAGPSFVLGAWSGAEPTPVLVAASEHTAWRKTT